MTKHIIIIATLIALTSAGCQKKDDTTPDPAKVAMTFNNPQSGQVFHVGDTVNIGVDVVYTTQLHGYQVKLTNITTGEELFVKEQHVHDDHFSIAEQWVDTLSAPANLKLEVTVEIDHDGNEASKEVTFRSEL